MLSKSGISLSWISAIKNILCITLTDIMFNILKCYNVSYILNVWQNSHKTFFYLYLFFCGECTFHLMNPVIMT